VQYLEKNTTQNNRQTLLFCPYLNSLFFLLYNWTTFLHFELATLANIRRTIIKNKKIEIIHYKKKKLAFFVIRLVQNQRYMNSITPIYTITHIYIISNSSTVNQCLQRLTNERSIFYFNLMKPVKFRYKKRVNYIMFT
jgi:hypothetical protein